MGITCKHCVFKPDIDIIHGDYSTLSGKQDRDRVYWHYMYEDDILHVHTVS